MAKHPVFTNGRAFETEIRDRIIRWKEMKEDIAFFDSNVAKKRVIAKLELFKCCYLVGSALFFGELLQLTRRFFCPLISLLDAHLDFSGSSLSSVPESLKFPCGAISSIP